MIGAMTAMIATASAVGTEPQPLANFMSAPAPAEIVYANRDGEDLVLHTFKPAGWKPDKSYPAIIWIHGGAWVGGNSQGSLPFGRYFANRGAVAFVITYRKAAPKGPGVADCLADCRSSVRYVRSHAQELGVDPERIAVIGESAGGHLAASLGTIERFNHPDDNRSLSSRPNAMVLYNPIIDMTEDDWIRYAVSGQALADKTSPRPSDPESIKQARALSPLFHVEAGQPPALVVHGRGDKVVRVEQAERFAEAMKSAGNRCDLVLYGHEIGHAFAITGYRWPEEVVIPAIREADKFLASLGWLEGQPTLTTSPTPPW
jgi:acetyl esterase/lipase